MNCDRLKPEFGTEKYRFGEFVKQNNPKGKPFTTRLSLVDTEGIQSLVASVYMNDTPSSTFSIYDQLFMSFFELRLGHSVLQLR